jgi:hypothetical protein
MNERCLQSNFDAHVVTWAAHSARQERRAVSKELRVSVCRLRELLSYDPLSGALVWLVGRSNAVAGSLAGTETSHGYMAVGIDGEKFRVHRVVWALVHGAWPLQTIDHIDGDRCNNKLSNLRCVSQAVNMQNMRKPSARNTSGLLGVYWSGRRGGWMASISIGGKQKRWGPYKMQERAHEAYVAGKRKYHEGCTL